MWKHYSEWRDHITDIWEIPIQAAACARSKKVVSLIQIIEVRETSFIADIVRQSQVMDDAGFRTLLQTRLRERYSAPCRATRRLERTAPSMGTLYTRLNELITSRSGGWVTSITPTRPMSVLISLNSDHYARALADYPHAGDLADCRARFLSSSVSDLVVTHMGHHPGWTEVRRACLGYLTTVLVVVWTLPMVVVGGLSQLSVLIQLVPGLSGWDPPARVFGVVQGVVPSVVTSMLMWLFLRFLHAVVEWAGYGTHTDEQLAIQRDYFFFLFV